MVLEDLKPGLKVDGVVPGSSVAVVAIEKHGDDAVELTFKTTEGALDQRILFRSDEGRLSIAPHSVRRFDAQATDFKLAAEAQRITLAGLFDPMLAVATSDVRPLPHQIQAVYGELLPRTPLRFLLADDPGAGKTIMAGLYVKELILREDVRRCLIIAPGSLVEQWQDELLLKFGLRFDLLTNQMIEASADHNLFENTSMVIARMDQLARNEDLQGKLEEVAWDLTIVDEAHRMGARYFGAKLLKTKRFLLGEKLAAISRHLLLMTATPHSGKEDDFQLFLTLLDKDRFEGKSNKIADLTGVMRRMTKEDLLTFEGKKLFPERIAETVPYELTALEYDLYERVTGYVRTGMNRAEKLGGKRKNTVGFALTVLQRRLASSPEAILRSLQRRSARLEAKRAQAADGELWSEQPDIDVLDPDEYTADEFERIEEQLVDTATAAQTVAELEGELLELAELIDLSRAVRDAGKDRKWSELSTIVQDNALAPYREGVPRKLIVFTEHRDTLEYLRERIASLVGNPAAVLAIHGGVARTERRRITEEFSKNPDCQFLIATDAAGEGLNLQAAHLMVNYDLPWNPNRIEQRFGRIHRIGQKEVCRLWNLVASNTREGEVFSRLLDKLEQMRLSYGGKVFDVLGEAFSETPLRTLLLDAIQYGERPDVRQRMQQVIDETVGVGVKALVEDRALVSQPFATTDLIALRGAMDDARARRLQPYYIELAFKAAFARLGGRIAPREHGRYEVSNVPAQTRAAASHPVATRYERVTFDVQNVASDTSSRADLIAPGHPLHDVVMAETIRELGPCLVHGATFVSSAVDEPQLLVGVLEQVVDGTDASVSRRFGYALVDRMGTVRPAGPAPYLDFVAAPETQAVLDARQQPWLARAEADAVSWVIANQLPEYLAEVRPRRLDELQRVEQLVSKRLRNEVERLLLEATVAREQERSGERPRESSEALSEKAAELEGRLTARLYQLERQMTMATKPPIIATAALVLPAAMFERDSHTIPSGLAVETKAVERRGVELVLAAERALGRVPVEQAFNNKGFDILSTDASGDSYRIEVKARIQGAETFFVTHNEVLTGKNAAPRYRLALVRVDSRGASFDEARYLDDPFASTQLGGFEATGIWGDWNKMWALGREPF